jgi:conjugative relaxase-like TrwC/TraI family protein
VIVSVTALGSRHGADSAAKGVVKYLAERSRQPTSARRQPPDAVISNGPGAYYADSVEGPGRWLGSGVGPAFGSGTVTAVELERLLLGQDPASGAQLRATTRAHSVDQSGDPALATGADPITLREAARQLGVHPSHVKRCAQRSRQWEQAAAEATARGGSPPRRPTNYLATLDGPTEEHPRRPYRVDGDELVRFAKARKQPAATVGFDVTFSAPKSVSVLWAVASQEVEAQILDGIEAAVRTGMRYLEQQAIACRIRGAVTPGDGLLAAGYLHATNRNLDPQLHWHVVVGNMTQGPDGVVRALDGRQLYLHAKTAGYLASAELRHQLTVRLGVGWGEVVHGIAEIAGVPEEAIRAASSRSTEIDRLTGELGLGSASARQVAAYQTRNAKADGVDPTALRQRWLDTLGDVGFTGDYVAQRVLGRRATWHEPDATTVARWYQHLGSAHGVTEQSATFDRRHVVQQLAELAGADIPARGVEDLADRWLASESVQVLADELTAERPRVGVVRRDGTTVRTPTGLALYTTPQLLALEQEVVATVEAGFATGRGVVDEAILTAAISTHEQATGGRLGGDQRAMVAAVCTSGDAVQCVLGPAGSGKTYALAIAARAWQEAGFTVWGASVNGTAAEQLTRATGIPSRTLASLLDRLDLADYPVLTDRHIIVVDEASTVGSRDLARLLRYTTATGASVRLVGDPAQHSAVDAGGVFRALVDRHPDRTPGLTVLRRQHGDDMADIRLALTDYRHGRIAEAWQRLEDNARVVTADSPAELLDTLCADWYVDRARHLADPDRVARSSMVAENHVERRALNNRARALLRADGTLRGEDVIVAGQRFAVGDEVICRTPAHQLHPAGDPRRYVRNGTRGTITTITRQHERIEFTVDFEGRGPIRVPHEFLTRNLRPRVVGGLTHAYALTSYTAQGETYRAGRMLATEEATRAGVYVGLSRGTSDARLYVVRADDVHPPRGPDDDLPALRDETRAGEALARRLETSGPEHLASEHGRDALAVARLRHRHTLPELETLAADGDRIAVKAARATARAVADAAISGPHPAVVTEVGPRPDAPAQRRGWDRAVGTLAVHWARTFTRPFETADGWDLASGDDPQVNGRIHDAAVAHLAADTNPSTLAAEARALHQQLTATPTPRDLAIAEARLDRARGGTETTDPLIAEVERLRLQVASAAPLRRRARRLDDALAVQVGAAVERPASYVIEVLGPRHLADDPDQWHRRAMAIERYRHRHLGRAPVDGSVPGHGGDPMLAAVGTRPTDRRAAHAWADATRDVEPGRGRGIEH